MSPVSYGCVYKNKVPSLEQLPVGQIYFAEREINQRQQNNKMMILFADPVDAADVVITEDSNNISDGNGSSNTKTTGK